MPGIIQTVPANCQDCCRCIRVCPVGAIRVTGGQARVDGELCVQCGICVCQCPQKAKRVESALDTVREMVQGQSPVAASIAPSFAALYDGWRAMRLPSALRKLGFSIVSEAAEGGKAVAEETSRAAGNACITTCCPAVVSYVRKYKPELVSLLMPVVSPMVAHGRMLKNRLGATAKVVYIGPCAAQKGEAMLPVAAGAVDAVLTFDELDQWMREEDIDLSRCPESGFETCGSPGDARLLPLEGGLLKTAGFQSDVGNPRVLHVSGAEEIIRLFDTSASQWSYDIIEANFCRGGCVGAFCLAQQKDIYTAARHVIAYASTAVDMPGESPCVELSASFTATPVKPLLPDIPEAKILQILEETGKAEPEARLDCGACGYKTCRENAIAVARGIAEPGMCVSYSRKKAERRANRIIETSPNGIVVVDESLNIVHMNARFQRMFRCGASLVGRPISHIVDPASFERLLAGAEGTQEAIRSGEGIRYQELIYTLPGEREMIGIYVDVSATTFDAKQVDLIKDQSLRHARELLEHQIRFSQEMAHFLGKSTAQTEDLVKRLMELYAEEPAR